MAQDLNLNQRLIVNDTDGVKVTGITSGSYLEISGNLPGYTAGQYPVLKSGGTIHFGVNGLYRAYLEGNDTYFGILNNSSVTTVLLKTNGSSYLNGGNVGIGTTTPGAKLDVAGYIKANDRFYATNGTNTLEIGSTYIQSYLNSGAAEASLSFYTGITEKMRIASDGNVGIGTASPTSKLQVSGNIDATGVISQTFWTNDSIRKLYADASLNFRTAAGTIEMILDGSGNLGIGTTSPSEKLEVVGGNVKVGNNYLFGWRYSSGDSNMYNYIYSSYDDTTTGIAYRSGSWTSQQDIVAHNFQTYSGGWATRLAILQNGNVGIGTASPTTNLHIAGSSPTLFVKGTANTDDVTLQLNANDYYYILRNQGSGGNIIYESDDAQSQVFRTDNSTGQSLDRFVIGYGNTANVYFVNANVGIGTTNPTSKLYVDGNMFVNDYLLVDGGIINNSRSAEKIISTGYFTNGVANQAVDLYFGNSAFWGNIEVSITADYSYQNAPGVLTKLFAIGVNPNNLIYTNESRVTEAMGATPDNIAIGDFAWDSTNSRYYIPISHIVSSGNSFRIRVRYFDQNGNSFTWHQGTRVSSAYTLTALSRQYVYYNDRVGIGTTSPSTRLHVKTSGNTDTGIRSDVGLDNNVASTPSAIFLNNIGGDLGDAVAATFGVGGTDRAKIISGRYSIGGYLQFQTGDTSNNLQNRVIITDAGNVGIGTTSPDAPLEVYRGQSRTSMTGTAFGTLHINGGETSSHISSITLSQYNNVPISIIGTKTDTSFGTTMFFGTSNSYVSGVTNTAMVINYDGNVGIGTNSPGARLHVNGNAQIDYSLIGRGFRSSNRGELHLNATGSDDVSEIFFGYGSGYSEDKIRWGISDRGTTTGELNFYKGPALSGFSPALTLYSNLNASFYGNVGIGTTSPGSKLDVAGDVRANSWLELRKDGAAVTTYESGIRWNWNGTNIFYFYSDNGDDGNLRIQSTNAGENDASPRLIIPRSSKDLYLAVSGGNVGIGTTSPEGKLDVVGSTINGTQQSDWSSDGVSYNSYGDLTISRTHGATKNSVWGFTGPLVDFRSSNSSHEWSVAQIMGTVDSFNGTNHQGGLMFLTSGGGSTDPTGRRTAGAAPQVRMAIGATGQVYIQGSVGIGTTGIESRLHVQETNAGSSGGILYLKNSSETAGTYTGIHFGTWGKKSGIFHKQGSYGGYGTGDLIFATNSTLDGTVVSPSDARMVITNPGNVGIGNTGPSYKLDVSGGIRATDYFISSAGATIGGQGPYDWVFLGPQGDAASRAAAVMIGDINGAKYAVYGGSYDLAFAKHRSDTDTFHPALTILGSSATDSSPDVYITNSLGIGTNSPSQKLSVYGNIYLRGGDCITWSNGDAQIDSTSYHLRFHTYDGVSALVERMRITSGGNVGFGTTSPSYKIDVSGGAIAIRGNAAGNSLRFDDSLGTSRNAMYVDTSNYLNVGNANYAGLKLYHTASETPSTNGYAGENIAEAFGSITNNRILAEPSAWLEVRVGTTDYVIPMYTTG